MKQRFGSNLLNFLEIIQHIRKTLNKEILLQMMIFKVESNRGSICEGGLQKWVWMWSTDCSGLIESEGKGLGPGISRQNSLY